MTDPRIDEYRNALHAMRLGRFQGTLPLEPADDVGMLGTAIQELGRSLELKFDEVRALAMVTEKINAGILLDEVLSHVYTTFQRIIPYDRIGFSLLEESETQGTIVKARWAKSRADELEIGSGYAAPLKGSSLATILETGRPRIINDLQEYLQEHPQSVSTRKILAEGMRSSITFPLLAMGKPIGFMFFSSMRPGTYQFVHVTLFQQIAGQLAVILEKSRLYQRLVELNDEKNRFLGMAAHDLRNPLSVLKGYLRLFRTGSLGEVPAEHQEIYEMMDESVDTMTGLINDLLDFSAIESGHLKLNLEAAHLAPVMERVVKGNALLARAKDIRLTIEKGRAMPRVSADPHRVDQILGNLITNALKFSEPGTTVTLATRQEGKMVWVSVQDQGQGIPEAELKNLFQAFGRTSTRSTAGEPCTGLGLAIVKRLVEEHGGEVQVESRVGKGTTVSFSLRACD